MSRQRRQSGTELNRALLGLGIVGALAITFGTVYYLNKTGNTSVPSREELEVKSISQHRLPLYPPPLPAQAQPSPPQEPTTHYTPDDAKRDLASFTLDMSTPYTLRQIRELAEIKKGVTIVAPNGNKMLVYLVSLNITQEWKEKGRGANLEEITKRALTGDITVWAGNIPERKEEELYLYQLKEQ